MSADILRSTRDHVGVVTLNRPASLNAWDMAMQAELAGALADMDGDASIQAIVLTGAGDRAFCAGQDLREAAAFAPETIDTWLESFRHLYESILAASKPVVAGLNGVAAGSGYQLALLCDVRVAHRGVRMGQPEVSSGIPSVTGMYLSERSLGASRMLELMLSGRLMEIEELVQVGLVHKVVDQGEVLNESLETARQLGRQPSVAIAETKARYRQTILPGLREAFAAAKDIDRRAWASGQPQEVMREFLASRGAAV